MANKYKKTLLSVGVIAVAVLITILLLQLAEKYANNEITGAKSFEGVLTAPCGGIDGVYFCSSPPSISYQNKKCVMNLLLKTQISNGSWWYDYGNIRTSFCFFEQSFSEKDFRNNFLDKRVIVLGYLKNATVCSLLMKCPEPECSKCNEQEVLIPEKIFIQK